MGLNFSHCDAYWGYIGFSRFRTRLAAEAGIALNCMEGFAVGGYNDEHFDKVEIFGPRSKNEILPSHFVGIQPVISWDKINNPIKDLLDHSDCEGILTPSECQEVAPIIRELVKDWPDDDRDKVNALELADGMDLASSQNENLEFL